MDYKDNQRQAQKRWMAKNPDYWRSYRDSHTKYVETNRQKQRERNRSSICRAARSTSMPSATTIFADMM